MSERIRVTGYLNVDDLPAAHIDLNDPTGLSPAGYESVTDPDTRYTLADLEDLELRLND